MRRLLFVLPAFRYGGTLTSFANLLILLGKEDYEIDVYAIVDEGDARNKIAKYACIVNGPRRIQNNKRGDYLSFRRFAKIVKDGLARMGLDIGTYLIKRRAQGFNCEKYDAVIAYQEGYPTEFVAHVRAKYKIAWIHSMYSRWGDSKIARLYDMMDRIVCVSETAKQDMLALYHNNTDKVHVVRNSLDKDEIVRLSEVEPSEKNDSFHIISVGRIDPIKRFSMIPVVVKELKDKGLKFKWSIIGGVADKREYKTIVKRIRDFRLEEYVILEGQMSNPYPAIKNSDLLVCLSSSETFNYTLTEARIMGVPVVSSDFPAAMEFVSEGQGGIICSIEKMAETICKLITDTGYYQRQKEALRDFHYDNKAVADSFKELLVSL